MISFALLVDAREPVASDVIDRVRAGAARSLTFVPADERFWRSPSGRTVVLAWERAPARLPTSDSWLADDSGVIVVRASLGPGRDAIRTGVTASADDRASTITDTFGTGATFRSTLGSTTIVSDRAGVAASIRPTPRRSPVGVGWLVHWFGTLDDSCGYEDVRRVTAGATLHWTGQAWTTADVPLFGTADDPQLSRSEIEDLLDEAANELVAAVAAVGALPLRIGLTGGRDSRVVLAAAARAGVADLESFTMQGTDEPDADGVLAPLLAGRMGVSHSVRRPAVRELTVDGYLDRLRSHVGRSEAMLPAAELRWQGDEVDEISLDGTGGELYRAQFDRNAPVPTIDQAVQVVVRRAVGRDPFVNPDLVEHHRSSAQSLLERTHLSTPIDAVQQLWFEIYSRRWIGTDEQLNGFRPAMRLLRSATLAQVSRAVGWQGRHDEVVHLGLLHRLAPDLARAPFAGRAVPPDVDVRFGGGHAPEPVVRHNPWGNPKGVGWDTLRQACRRQLDLADGALDDVLLPERVEAAIAEPRPADQRTMRAVHAVTAAATWMAHDEDRSSLDGGPVATS